ncbi:DUF4859 domain-containing protein [Draconibacterium sp. IB214405]|uniref:DUF4859 domain-containing protein n=1 Tax=Draconibacterium sp. IB214405 TaxID=3097352 RepID=UPI002A14C2B3|nr:DUF4859 domain-containing protein [Draconibacterium sp. IB214405]MDX8338983.1 DUF4859 domain-containing protein [Draconibacterium sp. IB214405]
MISISQYKLHKSEKSGLCSFFFIILFLFVFAACGNDSVTPEPDPEPDPTPVDTTGTTPVDTVVVLSESDVPDYEMFYKPGEHINVDFLRADSKWNFVRSKQSEHFFVFWEAGFGDDPNASSVPQALRVDVDDMLLKAEQFYNINVNTLGFAETGAGKSNLDNYKMQIYLFYTEEWMAYGSGYDDFIGALWVNPSTCKPVGSTIAHEIGHSFQYQVYADLLAYGGIENDFNYGFRYGFGGNGGNGFWEQCAQWQSFQSYPVEAFSSYNFSVHMANYHRHFNHEWQRYASYWLQYYWTDKHGIDFIGKLWRESVGPEDPIEAYMRINELTVEEMNAELYDAAAHLVTWDLDAIRSTGSDYIGQYEYKFYEGEDGAYQVAYSKCPGSTGYNVIPLNVPEAGTVVTTSFKALVPGSTLATADPGSYSENGTTMTTRNYNTGTLTRAGWRYGYVALMESGERVYGEMNRKTAADVEFTVPEGCERLWFVVLGAPSTYEAHPWDELESNDDQWPYSVSFANTDLLGNVVINPDDEPQDLTLTYDISFAADAEGYTGTTVNLNNNGDITKVVEALVMQPSAIASSLLAAKETPQEGKIAFAAVESDGTLNYNTTANGHGFWFDSNGDVIGWGSDNDSKVFSEFAVSNFEFNIGQYPGKSSAGDTYTIKEALVYQKDGTQYQVTFVFNITIN